ncbi:MAG: helix-turn-helix domain-containing protein [Candidatus Nealsonbacteria bacterium DGGOD1a]|jgi:transcriptional regulator with XRE-family HTH domain|nr:MAG: helix-turn-helix domain-containing protein [Candidatus Nealsonbacteria bacterium DGGOD1a]
MFKNLKKFGQHLKELRTEKGLGLREFCKIVDYDPSNWSKIERGIIAPPADEEILRKWAKVLGISGKEEALRDFVDEASIAQGIIPEDILSKENAVEYLPAFFRTVRNEKPTKEDIDNLINTIRNA